MQSSRSRVPLRAIAMELFFIHLPHKLHKQHLQHNTKPQTRTIPKPGAATQNEGVVYVYMCWMILK